MLRFKTYGTPFERGQQHGIACQDLAVAWCENNLRKLAERLGVSGPVEAMHKVEIQVDIWNGRIESACPELLEESRGIATGLGMDENEYFAAVYSDWLLARSDMGKNCTTAGFRDSAGRVLLGKTDDIAKSELGMNVLETTFPQTGYRHAHFHFAGTIWTTAGMNEHGLAIAMTGIPGPTIAEEGLPSLESLHTILPACATVAQVIEHVQSLRLNCYGFSLMVGDAVGELALIEKNGIGMACLPEQPGGFFLHTNHILDSTVAHANPSQQKTLQSNSWHRHKNGCRILPEASRSQSDMMQFLTDRNSDGPICQHGEDDMYTDCALLMIPSEKKMVFRSGFPDHPKEESVELISLGGETP